MRFAQGTIVRTCERANAQRKIRWQTRQDRSAQRQVRWQIAQGQTRWQFAQGQMRWGNLRRGICDGESAKGNLRRGICEGGRVLRTTDGRRSNVGSDCSKTNF